MNIRYPLYEGVYRILTKEGDRREMPRNNICYFDYIYCYGAGHILAFY